MEYKTEQQATLFKSWKQRAKKLKADVYALYFAYRDPRVPWYAKALAAVVVAYAFSPIDLIPDFIPVLGYLDDLVLIPLGVSLTVKMIPSGVMEEARIKVAELEGKPKNWIGAAVIIALWLTILLWLAKTFLGR
ncbi:MAG: YkvA family protein [Bacillota bacterium]